MHHISDASSHVDGFSDLDCRVTKSRLRHLLVDNSAICFEVDFEALIRNFLVMSVESAKDEYVVSCRIETDNSWPDNLPEVVWMFRVSLLFGLFVLFN